MSEYLINKGIGKQVEFKGLRAQYLFICAGGLLGVFLVVIVLSLCGVGNFIAILIGIALTGTVV